MSFKSSHLRKVLPSCDPHRINITLNNMLLFQWHSLLDQSRSLQKDPFLLCLQEQLCPFLKQHLSLKFVLASQSQQFLSFCFWLVGIVTVVIVVGFNPVVIHSVAVRGRKEGDGWVFL